MGELVKLPNIGPELERQLHLIGVDTVEELRRRGSKQAWLDIQKNDPSACFHRLCSLEGALHGVRKIMLISRSSTTNIQRDERGTADCRPLSFGNFIQTS